MLLVIFGAGASYDSAADYLPDGVPDIARPPLACELFENRVTFRTTLAKFSQCNPLVTRLSDPHPRLSLEEQLEQVQTEAEENPVKYKQLVAVRFYLRTMIWETEQRWRTKHRGITNYVTLLDDLQTWRRRSGESVLLVTFNYDKMLEHAFEAARISDCMSLDSYISNEHYKLFKVHGSVDWVRRLDHSVHDPQNRIDDENMIAMMIDQSSSGESFSAPIETISGPYVGREVIPMQRVVGLMPAIAIPVTRKTKFECPNPHLDALRERLPEVTKILAIGWRGTEKHFLKLLVEDLKVKPRHIGITARSEEDARNVQQNLRIGGLESNYVLHKGGFSESLRNDEINHFLHRPL